MVELVNSEDFTTFTLEGCKGFCKSLATAGYAGLQYNSESNACQCLFERQEWDEMPVVPAASLGSERVHCPRGRTCTASADLGSGVVASESSLGWTCIPVKTAECVSVGV